MNKAHTLARILLVAAGFFCAVQARAAVNPVSGVPLVAALKDANAIAAGRADLSVLRVEGVSMLPYFGTGAVLVIKHIPAEKLRSGMVVVYTNRFNETVAHRIEANKAGAGWVAKGYNNDSADSTLVNEKNLVGVVYVTFHSDAVVEPAMIAGASVNTMVALAAPAR